MASVWFRIFSLVNMQQFSPTRVDLVFQDWCANLEAKVPHVLRKGVNSLVMLVAWWLWKQRNKCVFEGILPAATRLYRTSKTTLRGGVLRVPKICAPSGLSLGAVVDIFWLSSRWNFSFFYSVLWSSLDHWCFFYLNISNAQFSCAF
jgi:hypothetical protein